jgi:hypothetical protein
VLLPSSMPSALRFHVVEFVADGVAAAGVATWGVATTGIFTLAVLEMDKFWSVTVKLADQSPTSSGTNVRLSVVLGVKSVNGCPLSVTDH